MSGFACDTDLCSSAPVESMRAFVIGGTGLVGNNLVDEFTATDHDVLSTYRSSSGGGDIQLEKTDFKATRDAIADFDPDVVIDTAAYHAVDDCETQRDRAWSVNATGTRNAAVAADDADAQFIYLSSDYVFRGRPSESPYTESDPIAPLNYYGETKYAAEQAAKITDEWTVLRPSVIYGTASGNFVTWALGELEQGNEISIVDDQISAPTFAPDLAIACVRLAEDRTTGLYHAAGPTSMSRYNLTVLLATEFGFSTGLIKPISTDELGQEASRPEDSTLDSKKLYEAIGYRFKSPKVGLREMPDRSV